MHKESIWGSQVKLLIIAIPTSLTGLFIKWNTNSMAYGTRSFNATFTRALQYSLSSAESTQFLVLIPIYLRFILILSSHLRSLSYRCTTCSNSESTHTFLHSDYMTWPSQSSRINHPKYICIRWTVQTMKFLIVEPSPLPLGPKYSPQDPVFKPLACIPPLMSETMFHKHTAQLVILLFYMF